ncbi:MAG: hypothetical protein MZW92_65095 [Comamonadaceae bacterium]|nr:hypothetical protein [Comamonadaceae bacterium]
MLRADRANASRRSTPTWPPTRMLAGSQIQPLPGAAQGTRRRRRRADAHAQGAPRLHRRQVPACWSTRCTAARPSSSSRPQVKFEDGRSGSVSADAEDRRRQDLSAP